MSDILCCGIATLDIINHVPRYPAEDEELRATRQESRSGGNAANTALVLTQLGHHVNLAAIFANDTSADWLLARMRGAGIGLDDCQRVAGTTPTSYITLSEATGSRTIVHYRDLPEQDPAHIQRALSHSFDWIHFEGRNLPALKQILPRLSQQTERPAISLEAEKHRDGLEQLLSLADVIMFSRPWAEAAGFTSAEAFLSSLPAEFDDKIVTCTWGAQGVWFRDRNSSIQHQPAVSVEKVVDSIGAGDCFNAGLIDALLRHEPTARAVARANELAARKIGQMGLDFLGI